MIRHRIGRVSELLSRREDVSELRVIVEGGESVALNYERLTGRAGPGDLLLLNTTAIHLSLGSGGLHFVEFNFSRPPPPFRGCGHIMKLRYTPWQMRVLSCEERASGHRPQLDRFTGLAGMPVLIGELQYGGTAAAVLKYTAPIDGSPISYRWNGAAAGIQPQRRSAEGERGSRMVTSGHAFGGDFRSSQCLPALATCRANRGGCGIIAPGPAASARVAGLIQRAGGGHRVSAPGRPAHPSPQLRRKAAAPLWREPPYPDGAGVGGAGPGASGAAADAAVASVPAATGLKGAASEAPAAGAPRPAATGDHGAAGVGT